MTSTETSQVLVGDMDQFATAFELQGMKKNLESEAKTAAQGSVKVKFTRILEVNPLP